jgi:hypothetical protein
MHLCLANTICSRGYYSSFSCWVLSVAQVLGTAVGGAAIVATGSYWMERGRERDGEIDRDIQTAREREKEKEREREGGQEEEENEEYRWSIAQHTLFFLWNVPFAVLPCDTPPLTPCVVYPFPSLSISLSISLSLDCRCWFVFLCVSVSIFPSSDCCVLHCLNAQPYCSLRSSLKRVLQPVLLSAPWQVGIDECVRE